MRTSLSRRVVLRLLATPLHRLLGPVVALEVTGRRTGRIHRFPVVAATGPDGLVVVPGRAATKTWWRNLRSPAPVRVLVGGRWRDGRGVALPGGTPAAAGARATYRARFPRAPLPPDQPVVQVQWVDGSGPDRTDGISAAAADARR